MVMFKAGSSRNGKVYGLLEIINDRSAAKVSGKQIIGVFNIRFGRWFRGAVKAFGISGIATRGGDEIPFQAISETGK